MVDFLLENIVWVAMAVLSAGGLIWTFIRGNKSTLQPQAAILEVSRNGGVFLDVRTAEEFTGGHIPRSQNIPAEQLLSRLTALAKYKKNPVVVVCQSGARARKLIPQLQQNGFEQVYILAGGVMGWRDANLPLFNKNKKSGKDK